MNDDDLYGPKLTPPPAISPLARGVAVAAVTVSLAVAGCGTANPGAPPDSGNPGVVDAGISAVDSGNPGLPPLDSGNPGVADAGISVGDAANPGLPPLDAGSDAANPGLPALDAGTPDVG